MEQQVKKELLGDGASWRLCAARWCVRRCNHNTGMRARRVKSNNACVHVYCSIRRGRRVKKASAGRYSERCRQLVDCCYARAASSDIEVIYFS